MSYQALYRTWRPEYFRDIVGQDHIVTTLINQIVTNRFSHAYMFCGSRGTGKTTTAKVLARAINCETPDHGEPCGQCSACRALAEDNCLDVVEMDAASNRGIDDARELIEKIAYPPTVCRHKVYILDEVHMLSKDACNALLKTLEEPPEHAVFILATTEPQKLLPTILSRCQRFDFKRIPVSLIEGRLNAVLEATGNQADREAVQLIARAAAGGMRDALSMMDMCLSYGGGQLRADAVREVLGASDGSFLFDFADALVRGDATQALVMIDRLMRDGRDPSVFCREVAGQMRALLVAKTCPNGLEDLLEITSEDAERLRAQADETSQARLMRLMDLFIRAENDMKWSSQERIILELCAVRGCRPEREEGEEALEDRLFVVEKAIAEGAVAAPKQASTSKTASAGARESAPAAAAPAKRAEPPASDAEGWKQALKLIGQKDPRGMIFLKKGRFIGLDGDTVQVEFPDDGSGVLKQLLDKADRKAALDGCVSEAFGRDMRLSCTLAGAPKAVQATPAQRANVDKIFEAFPRDKVEIVDEKTNQTI